MCPDRSGSPGPEERRTPVDQIAHYLGDSVLAAGVMASLRSAGFEVVPASRVAELEEAPAVRDRDLERLAVGLRALDVWLIGWGYSGSHHARRAVREALKPGDDIGPRGREALDG